MGADQALSISAKEAKQRRLVGDDVTGSRHADDFYPTPPEATRALLSVEKFSKYVWEPACGDGAISRVFLAAGHSVQSTDLVDRGFGHSGVDFLFETTAYHGDIVTNPPFKLAVPFIRKALDLSSRKCAFLLRINALEGLERAALFASTPLARVWVFSRRITFSRGGGKSHGGGMLAFAWFIWDHAHDGPPNLGWLDAKPFIEDQHRLFDEDAKLVRESRNPAYWDEVTAVQKERAGG